MWSWLSVALSGYISISANESNHIRQAAMFKTMSLLMLLVMLWSQQGLVGAAAWWVSLGLSFQWLLMDSKSLKNNLSPALLVLFLRSFATAHRFGSSFLARLFGGCQRCCSV